MTRASNVRAGDRILVSCITACGSCRFCCAGHHGQCLGGGWILDHIEELWIRNVTITTGLVDTYSTPVLLRLIANRQIAAGRFVTHHFELDESVKAYDVFARAGDTGVLKVVVSRAA